MKILFIHPPWPGKGYGLRSQNRWPRKRGDKTNRYPILLCYTATLLKNNNHDVKYIDSVYQDFDQNQTLQQIEKFSPDIIFIETATPTFDYDKEFIRIIKKHYPEIKVLVAGSHVTHDPVKAMKNSEIDVIIKGEMDQTTLNVVNAIKKNKTRKTKKTKTKKNNKTNKTNKANTNFKHIKGICYRSQTKIINNPSADLIKNLDKLPFPDRNLIPHKWYIEGHARKKPFTFVMGARGCPQNCTFCLWPNVYYNHMVRFRTPENIADELQWLIKKYKMKEIFFDEGTFNTSKKRVIDLCKEIIQRKIKILWSCSCRVDVLDLEMLKYMKKAGCKLICYGGESANTKTLKQTNKQIKLNQIKKAVKLTQKAGIICHMNFMIGFPWENMTDVKRTIDFALKIKPDTVQFSMVFPHPGSKMFDQAKENDWFYKQALNNFQMFDMTQGPVIKSQVQRDKMMRILNKAHANFFLRPSYIIKQILKIRDYDDLRVIVKGAISILKGKIFFRGRE